MARQFDVQEYLENLSIQELSESTLTKAQWTALAKELGARVTSGMVKAQIRCIAIKALIDSGRITDEEELESANELYLGAEADRIRKEEEKKEESVDIELIRMEREENLIKLRMLAERERIQAEREREEREKRERREREEEKAAEAERERIEAAGGFVFLNRING